MNDEILQNIWNQLTADGMTNSDFETWKSNFAGSEDIQKNVHGYLLENNHTDSDIDTWSSNVGLKKKRRIRLICSGKGFGVRYERGRTRWFFGWFRSNR